MIEVARLKGKIDSYTACKYSASTSAVFFAEALVSFKESDS